MEIPEVDPSSIPTWQKMVIIAMAFIAFSGIIILLFGKIIPLA